MVDVPPKTTRVNKLPNEKSQLDLENINYLPSINVLLSLYKGYHIFIIKPEQDVIYPPTEIKVGKLKISDYGGILRLSSFDDFINVQLSNNDMFAAVQKMVELIQIRGAQEVAFRGFEPAQRYAKVLCKGLNIGVINFKDEELYQHLVKRVETITSQFRVSASTGQSKVD